MSIAWLDRLMRHMEWADAHAWASVLACEARADARVRELLHHGHAVQWAYLQIWRREPLRYRELEEFDDLADIADWGRAFHDEARPFLAGLDEADLDRTVEFPWRDTLARNYGGVPRTDLRDSLLQVPMHSCYHRGQIAMHVRRLGGEPVLTDYIVWTWSGQPSAEWPDSPMAGDPMGDPRRETHGGRPTAGDPRRETHGGRRTAGDERRVTNGG